MQFSLISLILFIANTCIHVSGEYYINNSIPSYLYRYFDDIKEEIFPSDIRMNISFSRISGTLLYSIDKNINQLIVTLSDIMEPTIKVEFRKQTYFESLSTLCGCERCRYEILDLRIQIESNIYLQCNGRPFKSFQYSREKQVNEAYPVPYSKKDINERVQNEAHLWVVNQEQYKDIYHDPHQLLGCIFNVWYRENELIFTKISDYIERKCRKTCIGDICNGGRCYETYNGEPVCDCTKTFLDGPYCKNNIASINKRINRYFVYEMLKVSWRSSSMDILLLNNKNVEINLFRRNKRLCFKYKYSTGPDLYTMGTLSENYIPNREYILIIHFLKTSIDIQLLNNGSKLSLIIMSNRDLQNELFTSLTLQSRDGYIDIWQKTPKQFTWRKISKDEFQEIIQEEKNIKSIYQFTTSSSLKITVSTYQREIMISISLAIVVALLLILGGVMIYWRFRRRIQKLVKDKVRETKTKFEGDFPSSTEQLLQNTVKSDEIPKEKKLSVEEIAIKWTNKPEFLRQCTV